MRRWPGVGLPDVEIRDIHTGAWPGPESHRLLGLLSQPSLLSAAVRSATLRLLLPGVYHACTDFPADVILPLPPANHRPALSRTRRRSSRTPPLESLATKHFALVFSPVSSEAAAFLVQAVPARSLGLIINLDECFSRDERERARRRVVDRVLDVSESVGGRAVAAAALAHRGVWGTVLQPRKEHPNAKDGVRHSSTPVPGAQRRVARCIFLRLHAQRARANHGQVISCL
ncbi:hypothetical protein OH77DRAFT_1189834 [Trametes cingulata]|nr:hypothetical protein OH77DRAFT_1189834 [Trametes cingulata]